MDSFDILSILYYNTDEPNRRKVFNDMQNSELNLYQRVYQDLLSKIRSGELPAHTKLPTVAELSEQYGVSKITTKKATDMLVADGLLEKHPGKGIFVTALGEPSSPQFSAPRPQDSRLIGVIMDGISDSYGVRSLIALELALGQAGYTCVTKFSTGDEGSETACINKLLAAGVSGLIIKCVSSDLYNERILELSLQNFPMIFLDRILPGLRIPYVGIDHLTACQQLCDQMFARGHRDLALAYCDKSIHMTSVSQRISGFKESCLRHRGAISPHYLILPGDPSMSVPDAMYTETLDMAINYLNNHPQISGVLTLSNGIGQLLSIAAHKIYAEQGRKIEVASFDATDTRYPEYRPALYVRQNEEALALACKERIIQCIEGQKIDHATFTPYEILS